MSNHCDDILRPLVTGLNGCESEDGRWGRRDRRPPPPPTGSQEAQP